MTFYYLKFLNVEYWYCLIYSIFGGKCTKFDAVPVDAQIGAGGLASTTDAVNAATSSAAASTGFFHSIVEAVLFIGTVIGGVLTFFWTLYTAIAYTFSGILILLILAAASGLFFIRYRELSLYGTLPAHHKKTNALADRWQSLLSDAMSSDPKHWREGILQADDMLGELLASLGYAGSSTAEKLRAVQESAFVTLPAAWEAHRIRNFISARSSNYILTQREAFRVMKLYEQVFEEFNFI
jgi:hypothetical protein